MCFKYFFVSYRPKGSIVYLKNNDKISPFDFGHGHHREQVATLLREKEVFIHSPPPLYRMIYLMWSAPITKFWTFQVSFLKLLLFYIDLLLWCISIEFLFVFQIFYMIYLGFFSMAVLWPSCGNKELDIIVCSWTSLIAIEYIRRTYVLYKVSIHRMLYSFLLLFSYNYKILWTN